MEINLGMLRKLRIKNFKRWKDAGMIEFVSVIKVFFNVIS